MNRVLEFTTDVNFDIVINRNRDLDQTLHCVLREIGMEEEMNFDFSLYEEAIMHVKKRHDDLNVALTLNTVNGTIQFLDKGILKFKAEPSYLKKIRAGEYVYDLYLYGNGFTKRQFISGKFIVKDTTTN